MNLKKFYMDAAMRDITSLGTIYFLGILIVALFSFGQHNLVYKLIIGQIIMFMITMPLKLTFFRNRPNRMHHKNIIERIEASSFPSVHTFRAFFISTVLILTFNNLILTLLLSLLSFAVAYSRIYLKKHYYSDIVVALFLGILLGYGVMNYV